MPIGRWEGNPHGIPEFEPHESLGGYPEELSGTKIEEVAPVFTSGKVAPERVEKKPHGIPEFEEAAPYFSRTQLFCDIRRIMVGIIDLELELPLNHGITEVELDSASQENLVSPHQALKFSFESIDERCLSLMAPMRDSFLKEMFPHYNKYSFFSEKIGENDEDKIESIRNEILQPSTKPRWPKIDFGVARQRRYEKIGSILNNLELTTIEEADNLLDLCDQQREHHGWNGYRIYKLYDNSLLGDWKEHNGFLRPWHNELALKRIFPTLSAEAESDITPIPEINEND